MARKRDDLAGQRFGRILVLEFSHTASNAIHWHCRCDCGTEKTIAGSALRRGTTVSCGCQRRESFAARGIKRGIMPHASRTPTYHSWANMIRRTTNPGHERWAGWGGRGIKVCDRWRDFWNFLADMGEKPPGTTLDRIDNDGDYEPGNCRWATHAQQARNQRRAKLTTLKILDIRRLYELKVGIKGIAAITGVDRHTVGTVCAVVDALSDL